MCISVLYLDHSVVSNRVLLSFHISEITRLQSGLHFEFRREVVGRIKIQFVGNLLDDHVGSAQQFLGTLQFQVLLVECRRDARIFLEEFAEGGIAYSQLLGYLLYGHISFHFTSHNQARAVYHVNMLAVLAPLYVALKRIHHANQMVHNTYFQKVA